MDDGLSVRAHEPLSRHTALRTGGPCGVWVVAHELRGLATLVADCRRAGWRLTLLGAGTRVVVRDGGIVGAVGRLGVGFCTCTDDGQTWSVGASLPVPALVAAAGRAGRTGVEGFAAVPGSVGASLLHDPGWETVVESVSVLRRGKPNEVPLSSVQGRRKVVVLGARLRLGHDAPEAVAERTLAVFSAGTPVPCGSWYEATRSDGLRDLLRSARLQMVRLRQVAIPEAAPEGMINLGGGEAADLALLHRSAIERVKKVRGEQLVSRVQWMGSASA